MSGYRYCPQDGFRLVDGVCPRIAEHLNIPSARDRHWAVGVRPPKMGKDGDIAQAFADGIKVALPARLRRRYGR